MSIFSSKRERTLWLLTIVVTASIFISLGFAGQVAGFLRQNGLLETTFMLCALIIAVAISVQWLRGRPRLGELWVMVGVFAIFLLAWLRMEQIEERTHLMEYSVLALLIYHAFLERRKNLKKGLHPGISAILLAGALGWIDEGIQAVLPSRVYDFEDVLFNLFAVVATVGASVLIERIRLRKRKNTE